MSTAKAKGFEATRLRHTCFSFEREDAFKAKLSELVRQRIQFSVAAERTFWTLSWPDTVAATAHAA